MYVIKIYTQNNHDNPFLLYKRSLGYFSNTDKNNLEYPLEIPYKILEMMSLDNDVE